ncbi:MAG: cardiolipin synthase [Eubacterium sp.]|nr:cardiolipin synthase [Eubacterium sp.]
MIFKKNTIEKKAANKNGVKRLAFAALSMLIEIMLIVLLFTSLYRVAEWVAVLTKIIGLIFVLYIYGQHKTSSMKMPWIIFILMFPVFGLVMYLLVGLNGSTKKKRKAIAEADEWLFKYLPENTDEIENVKKENTRIYNICSYIEKYAGYPVYQNSDVKYYDKAIDAFNAQLEELKKAKNFIFMEYHAIENKESWKKVEDVLFQKVSEGVEVRVFYDDMGSISFVNTDFARRLRENGIKCQVFNEFSHGINFFLNNRDHRKITVIDGRVAFTGGYNLANEYFGITEPYGKWKDSGIKVTGEAVRSFTVMFLEMWNINDKNKMYIDEDVDKYFPQESYLSADDGYIQPYADSPLDDEQVGEEVYISIINKADKYCYFVTPYLIITDEMIHAFSLAAKRGVDVRIITPGIPDKKIVYGVTRSFYNGLVRNGVRIYEWTPGFSHAKMSVADDIMATCGTINLDYRSLYHHFENGCFMYNMNAVKDIKADFEKLFTECNDVTENYKTGRSSFMRFGQMVLRLFAELM